jgi:predicted enzyme related to lactoylglutathione lyase
LLTARKHQLTDSKQRLMAVLQALRDEGCKVLEKMDDSEYGKFGWVMDPEGNKVELWEPPPGQ